MHSERSIAVLDLCRIFRVGCLFVLLFAGLAPAAEEAPRDATPHSPSPAVELLLRAQLQFQTLDFTAARESLWEVYPLRGELDDAQRQVFVELLGEVDHAITGQVISETIYDVADRAMASENWQIARDGFARVAVSPYLQPALRGRAKEQMAAAEVQLAAELALAPTPAEADAEPIMLDALAAPTDTRTKTVEPAKAEEKPAKKAAPARKAKAPAKPQAADALSELKKKKIKVGMLISQGKDALNKNQPAKAARYFQRALQIDPDDEMARRQLDFASMQTAQPGDAAILTDYMRQQRIAKQIAEHDIRQAMNKSMELMAKAENRATFDDAEQAAVVARNILQNNKRLFTVTEYRERLAKAEDQINWIQTKKEEWQKVRVAKQVDEISRRDRVRRAEVKLQREQKIAELTIRAHTLRRDKHYDQALRVMHQIVELDSGNQWALDNIYMLRQIILLQQQREMTRAGEHSLAQQSAATRAENIPWYDKIRYPKDWKELPIRRERFGASVATESEENRRVRKKLQQHIANVKLVGVKFEDAIDYLREHTGVSFYVSWGVMEQDNPDIRSKKVDVKLDDVAAETVLKVLLDDAGGGQVKLGYVINNGFVSISTQEKLNILTYARVYDIRDLLARVPNFVGPRVDLEAISESQDSSSDSGSSGGGSVWGEGEDDERPTSAEDDVPTRSEMIQMVKTLIQTTIDRESWYPNGTAAINELSGNLVITQTAENHRRVNDLIGKMRESRTIQVSIEARFITVNTGYLSQIGVDLDFYFNLGSDIGGGGFQQDPYLTGLGGGNMVPGQGASGWNQNGYNAPSSFDNFSPIGVQQNSSGFANLIGQQTNVPGGGIGSMVGNSALALAGTFLDDIQVDFLIRATQAHASTRLLTAPRVTLFNGQRAYMSVATQQAYIAEIEPIVSENAVGLRPVVRYAPTGTMLDVDATVSHDRRYVTMTLRPQIVTLNLSTAAGNIGGINYVGGLGLPNITMQDIQTTVSIPGGGTLLIGGQRLSGEIEREMGVPVISKLPIINRAFTNKGKLRDEQTLLILVKPKIIIQDEVEMDPRLRLEVEAYQPGFSY